MRGFTTENRIIIFGLVISTLLIMAIAIFATVNIQKNLDESYKNFGQVISKTIAVESADLIKDIPKNDVREILKTHADMISKSHRDIVYIEFRDSAGNLVYKTQNKIASSVGISVSSPITNFGAVTIGLSGSIIDKVSSTTRASILFVFTIVLRVI